MTSGIGPYVVNEISSAAGVLETTIIASKAPMVDLGLGPGLTANVETYNGAIPGPVLKLDVGDDVIVRLINRLDHPTGIHWHGIELANSADGTEVTQEPVVPAFTVPPPPPAPAGGTYLYKFKVPRPGLYWYHPHHHLSINRVFRGLYGMIVVADPLEAGLIAAGVLPGAARHEATRAQRHHGGQSRQRQRHLRQPHHGRARVRRSGMGQWLRCSTAAHAGRPLRGHRRPRRRYQ